MLSDSWHRVTGLPQIGLPGWGHVSPIIESVGEGRAGSLWLLPLTASHLVLPASSSRIGRKATILVQLLFFALFGLATAFMPSFELYMVLRFAVATAVAGYTFSNVTLREYVGPEAIGHTVSPWGLATRPRLPVRASGTCT